MCGRGECGCLPQSKNPNHSKVLCTEKLFTLNGRNNLHFASFLFIWFSFIPHTMRGGAIQGDRQPAIETLKCGQAVRQAGSQAGRQPTIVLFYLGKHNSCSLLCSVVLFWFRFCLAQHKGLSSILRVQGIVIIKERERIAARM